MFTDQFPFSVHCTVSIIHFSAKVGEALADRRPVVALESSVLAQGLPIPANADAARRMTAAVEGTGAVPAISAVVAGNAMFGLEEPEATRDLVGVTRGPAMSTADEIPRRCRSSG